MPKFISFRFCYISHWSLPVSSEVSFQPSVFYHMSSLLFPFLSHVPHFILVVFLTSHFCHFPRYSLNSCHRFHFILFISAFLLFLFFWMYKFWYAAKYATIAEFFPANIVLSLLILHQCLFLPFWRIGKLLHFLSFFFVFVLFQDPLQLLWSTFMIT